MNNYRLLKWYPSLPKNWETGMEVGVGDYGSEDEYFPCNSKYTNSRVTLSELKDKGFWEKIVEKDYEILSLLCKGHDKPYVKHENGLFGFKERHGYAEEDMLSSFNIIRSVKRLSDGEVFTIGDKYESTTGTFTIKSFRLCESGFVEVKAEEFGATGLNFISKVADPVFTTEDGVGVFKGDRLWLLGTNNWIITELSPKYNNLKSHPFKGATGEEFKYFSSKKAAENYVLVNRPSLSITDIKQTVNFGHMDKLMELVKSRI